MDGLTFTAEIVKASAWPVTTLLSVYLLRKPLARLIPLLKHVKYKDFELDFNRRIQETAEAASTLSAPEGKAFTAMAVSSRLTNLAQLSPRDAILEAWLRVETAAREAAKRGNLDLQERQLQSPLQLIHALENSGVIKPVQAAVFQDLRSLRNSAAHAVDFEPSAEDASKYVSLATRLEQSLQAAKPAG